MVRSVTTRPAVPADAADLVGVHVRTWRQAYAGIMPDEILDGLDGRRQEQVRRVRERLSQADPRFRTVVAVSPAAPGRAGHDPGRVLGFATFGPYRLEQGRADGAVDPSVGEVLAIYVDPPHQGRGAGRALMAEAVTALRTAGAGEVRLWVLEENAPSLRFYQRYGFVPDGERHLFRVHRPDGSPVDLPEVRLMLRGGGAAAGGRAAAAELGPGSVGTSPPPAVLL
jgi:ribosomal protein S18 acetylase RimI-like enzyme